MPMKLLIAIAGAAVIATALPSSAEAGHHKRHHAKAERVERACVVSSMMDRLASAIPSRERLTVRAERPAKRVAAVRIKRKARHHQS